MYDIRSLYTDAKYPGLLQVPLSPTGGCEAPVLGGVIRPFLPPPTAFNYSFLHIRTTQEAAGLGRLYSLTFCSYDSFRWA